LFLLQSIIPKTKRGRPVKRPIEVETLIEAFGKLTRLQIDALDKTPWSRKSLDNDPNVWSIMCSNLKMKDDEKNKKWLAHVWKNNMWSIAYEVRRCLMKYDLN
jgi:hypothetical protein